ncbi:hypothetical protein HanIR_Chr03g0113131 [Helianthus annuus]|nr:hypothetical protein HanIR_Chr03g0113131 [Helianthus annuus]
MPTQGQIIKRQAHAGAEYRNKKSAQGLDYNSKNKQQSSSMPLLLDFPLIRSDNPLKKPRVLLRSF